jgi:CRISPR/Cas system-associated exonuclease Cas4 (RecB family)
MDPEPFLKEVARHFLKSGLYVPEETCIVFPNKRAIVYFTRHLSELSGMPFWAPQYRTITRLMEELSGLVYADRVYLDFEIFRLYAELTGSNETFDKFYPLTETLLTDFDEIDKYLVNAGDLFRNLASLKDIASDYSYLSGEQVLAIQRFWKTFDPVKLSEGQKSFLSLWEVLPLLYERLKESLASKGIAYEGMAYRAVAEKIQKGQDIAALNYGKYLFTGFNALNSSERSLFRHLKNSGKAEFFYDYDDYYVNNDLHEAGKFIRNNLHEFPPAKQFAHNNMQQEKEIFFLPVPSDTGQARAIPYILDQLGVTKENSTSTAVVLADEKLLLPVLYSLPENIDEVNVTMGYPVSETSVFSLIDSLAKLEKNSRMTSSGKALFEYAGVQSLMKNPLLDHLKKENEEAVKRSGSHPAFLKTEDIPQFEAKNLIFENDEIHKDAVTYVFRIVEFIIRSFKDDENQGGGQVNMSVLLNVYELARYLYKIITDSGIKPGSQVIFKLFLKILRKLKIPFEGEPLAGLQVMGILETRTIDFENVVILSMNEGTLPASPLNISIIPYNLRKGFGMPTSENDDAISAYYFYRLLQKAKNVYLVYNSAANGISTGERSRFMHQILYEFPVRPKEKSFVFNITQSPAGIISVDRTPAVTGKLRKYLAPDGKVLSPSAINEYINCPLKFYLKYIAGLPVAAETIEGTDPRMFGNVLHESMKLLYEEYGREEISKEAFEDILKDRKKTDSAVTMAFNRHVFEMQEGDEAVPVTGLDLVVCDIITKYISQIIKFDMQHAPLSIISLEGRFSAEYPVFFNGDEKAAIMLGGIIDRIDYIKGTIRILDYKTGIEKISFTTIESLFDSMQNKRNEAALQVFIYASVYSRIYPDSRIEPGLVFVQKSSNKDFSHIIKCGGKGILNFSDIREEFETLLSGTINKIFSHGAFTQTENKRTCEYCDYRSICHR